MAEIKRMGQDGLFHSLSGLLRNDTRVRKVLGKHQTKRPTTKLNNRHLYRGAAL